MKLKIGDRIILRNYFPSGPTIGKVVNVSQGKAYELFAADIYHIVCENGMKTNLNQYYMDSSWISVLTSDKNFCLRCPSVIPLDRAFCCECLDKCLDKEIIK